MERDAGARAGVFGNASWPTAVPAVGSTNSTKSGDTCIVHPGWPCGSRDDSGSVLVDSPFKTPTNAVAGRPVPRV